MLGNCELLTYFHEDEGYVMKLCCKIYSIILIIWLPFIWHLFYFFTIDFYDMNLSYYMHHFKCLIFIWRKFTNYNQCAFSDEKKHTFAVESPQIEVLKMDWCEENCIFIIVVNQYSLPRFWKSILEVNVSSGWPLMQ